MTIILNAIRLLIEMILKIIKLPYNISKKVFTSKKSSNKSIKKSTKSKI